MCDIFSLSLEVIRILFCENFHFQIGFPLSCLVGRDQTGQNLLTGGITKNIKFQLINCYSVLYAVILVFMEQLEYVIKTVS